MRIGLVSTLATPVRRSSAGTVDSVEAICWLLARELTHLGHEVTLFAAADSRAHCQEVVSVPGPYGSRGLPEAYLQAELFNLAAAVERAATLDVLHSHAYLLGRLLERLSAVPMVHTLHTQPYEAEAALARLWPGLHLTALSAYQWSRFPDLQPVIVPSAADPAQFTLRRHPERRLCYLGRFMPQKGPLEAIRVARALDMPILLAGPENAYFRDVLRREVDGSRVEYVGAVGGTRRDDLLGRSSALVYPVQEGEPFGLVMVEAMMCGTPVLATDVGATREVVDDGVTGRVAPLGDLVHAASEVLALDRARVRAAALARYAPDRMARDYEAVYTAAVTGHPLSGGSAS
jgi:glycosyltransferase involved in cell wall biosynthesis